MEALVPAFIAFASIGALVLLDLLAVRFGVDSRPSIGDDHARSIGR